MKTWIDRLPRPERSGTIGAIMMFNLLVALVIPMGIGKPSLMCTLMPLSSVCGDGGDADDQAGATQEHTSEWRYISNVYFGPSSRSGKTECTCHFDVKSGNELWHEVVSQSPTCDSVRGYKLESGRDLEQWKDSCWHRNESGQCDGGQFMTLYVEGRTIEFKIESATRYHCTNDAKYSSMGEIKDLQ